MRSQWTFDLTTRPARLLLQATRAGLCALTAVLAWDANAGTFGALLAGGLVAWLTGALADAFRAYFARS